MNKKGVDLTINTIIIAVLVVLVLIVVTTFFLGGFSRVTGTISNVFFPLTTGTDLTIAIQSCEQKCDQAKVLTDNLRKNFYCQQSFIIDKDQNGKADRVDGNDDDKSKAFIKYYCSRPADSSVDLGVACEVVTC
ncbi:MAG: hypothetical protein AABW58_00520 [Nanoarchaeota archaeon]